MPDREIIENISHHYSLKLLKSFNNDARCVKCLELIAKAAKELYRYFEPQFFLGEFYICKHFNDEFVWDERTGHNLIDKNVLFNKNTGNILIQVFNDGTQFIWEEFDSKLLKGSDDNLIYKFSKNKEYFIANKDSIDITYYSDGSRFATQFKDLVAALIEYSNNKIYHSSCSYFSESWADKKRLFFKGGGKGSKIPEKHMQKSLHEFLSIYFARGIKMDSSREYNVGGNSDKPKPVDVKVQWTEANRIALIEVKFVGTVRKEDGDIYEYSDSKVNDGINQLKEYFDKASTDHPTSIIKSYLVVIDGRRKGLAKDSVTISYDDGMYFKDIEINIQASNRFYECIQGFEKPIRMFAKPICS